MLIRHIDPPAPDLVHAAGPVRRGFMGLAVVWLAACSTASQPETPQAPEDRQQAYAMVQQRLEACGAVTPGVLPHGQDWVAPGQLECQVECFRSTSCEDLNIALCQGEGWLPDGSALADCVRSCAPRPFVCDNGQMVFLPDVCDGFPDCPSGEDERDCPEVALLPCDNGERLEADQFCNWYPECSDGSDEAGCDLPTFACTDGAKVPAERECDGESDCPDGSDEAHCQWAEPICE